MAVFRKNTTLSELYSLSPTKRRRLELQEERAQRHYELEVEAQRLVREAAVEVTTLDTLITPDTLPAAPVHRLEARTARLEAVVAALRLAERLWQVDDPERQVVGRGGERLSANELLDQLTAALGRWKRGSEGWYEERYVPRPRVIVTQDPTTAVWRLDVVWKLYGPYYYWHWRRDGAQQTQYLGKQRPEGFEPGPPPALPAKPADDQAGPLTRQALALAYRLVEHLAEPELRTRRRRRLIKVLRHAARRSERRLQREAARVPDEL